jgi:hypothetical protein
MMKQPHFVNVVAPNHHYLESWGDDSATEGYYTVIQPTINPVYNTRQAEQSLLVWSDNPVKDYYTYVSNNWNKTCLLKAVYLAKKVGKPCCKQV